jgi:hypothetical protein
MDFFQDLPTRRGLIIFNWAYGVSCSRRWSMNIMPLSSWVVIEGWARQNSKAAYNAAANPAQ